MLTKDFDFTLPDELIARYPAANRTDSRLLALNPVTGDLTDYKFADLMQLFNPGDLIILNNTKVLPARMYGQKQTGGKVEILIERIISNNSAWVQIRASKSPKSGTWLILNPGIQAQVREFDLARGMYLLDFKIDMPLLDILDQHGEMPLPPYLARNVEEADKQRYQTVYAENLGSVAAPTAGLHFSEQILADLANLGVKIGCLTLHVGAGTFQPLRVENIADHKMHYEQFSISQDLCEQIIHTKQSGGRVICVGTTTVRALESAALLNQDISDLQPQTSETNIFITPGFKFKIVDALLTNFHLPCSTLLMLVCALAGKQHVLAAYQHAIANRYRFYSYGDAMLITGN